jgi:hypothetical protein
MPDKISKYRYRILGDKLPKILKNDKPQKIKKEGRPLKRLLED